MKPRSSLLAAVACGAAAVALVAADLAFNVDARLEAKGADGSWRVVAQSDAASSFRHWSPPGCGNDLRLTVHNGLPWATTVTVHTTLVGSGTSLPRTESWSLAAGEARSHEYHLNGTAPARDSPSPGYSGLQVQVGDDIHLYVNLCVEVAA